MSTQIDPLDFFKEELKDQSVEVQLNAAKALKVIIKALGPQRSANELIPYLDTYCFPVPGLIQAAKDSAAYSNTTALSAKEDVLAEIATQLDADCVRLIGGSTVCTRAILPLLEKLTMVEETVIRENACSSIASCFQVMTVRDVKEYGKLLMVRLASGDFWVNRSSATMLAAGLYKSLESRDDREQIRKTLQTLSTDEMPMVKAQAYKELVKLIKVLEPEQCRNWACRMLENLHKEILEDTRGLLVDLTEELLEAASASGQGAHIPQLLEKVVADPSWRIRKKFASRLKYFAQKSGGAKMYNEQILPVYAQLLTDQAVEVKKEAVSHMTAILGQDESFKVPTARVETVIGQICDGPFQNLCSDSNVSLRTIASQQITALARVVGDEATKKSLIPIMKDNLKDESSDVRKNLCSSIGAVVEFLDPKQFDEELGTAVQENANDSKWRVRQSVISSLAKIALSMGHEQFATSPYREILVNAFTDPSSKCRQEAVRQVQEMLADKLKDYTLNTVLDVLVRQYGEARNYLHRITPLMAAGLCAQQMSTAEIRGCTLITEVLPRALHDTVVNVRFYAAKVIRDIATAKKLPPQAKGDLRAKLTEASKDEDADMKYFCQQALAAL